MKITVIGTGYVGLVSGTCFAELGHDVTCVDNNPDKISTLQAGRVPIYEPGLEALIQRHYPDSLSFTSDINTAFENVEAVFLAVGTPTNEQDGSADLSYLFSAVEEIAPVLPDECVVVTKSTVPVGTGQKIAHMFKQFCPNKKIHIASNPEFLREGSAVDDFLHPDRIIIGVDSVEAETALQTLYQPMIDKNVPLLSSNIPTAELTKYAANAFLATKIGFINEVADLCEQLGADVEQVAYAMGLDQRIGSKYLVPGPGFGGSCFPKDTKALVHIANECNAPSQIVEAVIAANDRRKENMATKIIHHCGGVKGKKIALLGLAFKANTDDMRSAAALVIIEALLGAGASLSLYDPVAMDNAKTLLPSTSSILWAKNAYEAIEEADAVAIITEWDEFKQLDWQKIVTLLSKPIIIDLRNILDPQEMHNLEISYHGLGKA